MRERNQPRTDIRGQRNGNGDFQKVTLFGGGGFREQSACCPSAVAEKNDKSHQKGDDLRRRTAQHQQTADALGAVRVRKGQQKNGQREFEDLLQNLHRRVPAGVPDCHKVAAGNRGKGDERQGQREQAERYDRADVMQKPRPDQRGAGEEQQGGKTSAKQCIEDRAPQDGTHALRIAPADRFGDHAGHAELDAGGGDGQRKAVDTGNQGKQSHRLGTGAAGHRNTERNTGSFHQKCGGGQ